MRREQMIKRAAQRNANQPETNLFSNILSSSKKLISEISNVSFETPDHAKEKVRASPMVDRRKRLPAV